MRLIMTNKHSFFLIDGATPRSSCALTVAGFQAASIAMPNQHCIASQIRYGVITVIIVSDQYLSAPNAQASIYWLLDMGLNA
jgi:hypothetical protein